jgi:arsenate reductase-like glutaredoxin family protein
MTNKYKILKLKSGEEIIARIVGSNKNKMILERPMIFKTTFQVDGYGRKREITFLRDWLQNTNDIKIQIPKDYIASFLAPNVEVSKLYDLEKERDDTGHSTPPDPKTDSPKNLFEELSGKNPQPNIKDILDSLIEDKELNGELEDEETFEKFLDSIDKHKDSFDQLMNDADNTQDYIVMNMMFPPSLLEDLIDRGIIDAGELSDIMSMFDEDINKKNPHPEGLSDEYTGDEEDRKDFGNKWSDWSSDLNDYFD